MARPNILLVTCHDLGQHLGCYGVGTVDSERFDRFAAEGVRFARAFCTHPTCSPSRAALATGRYPHSNGCLGLAQPPFNWSINDDSPHLAKLLGQAGYETALFRFQHVTRYGDDAPTRLGFDRFLPSKYGPETAASFRDWLGARTDNKPFYAEVNFSEPHRPWLVDGLQPDSSRGVTIPDWMPDTPESREEMAEFQAAIRVASESFGALLDALDAHHLTNETIVLFCADHGMPMPRAKGTLYDPGIEVACLLRWPGELDDGRVCEHLVSNIDLAPTLLSAVGEPVPANMQGRSLLPLLAGEEPPRDAVFTEKNYHAYRDPMRCIRTHTHKLIRNFETAFACEIPTDIAAGQLYRSNPLRYLTPFHPELELYDLRADPNETRNLADEPAAADLRAELDARLWAWMEETDDPLLTDSLQSPAMLQALSARP